MDAPIKMAPKPAPFPRAFTPASGGAPSPTLGALPPTAKPVADKVTKDADWFRPDELVTVQGKQYPVVGGRLRLFHKFNDHGHVQTEIVQYDENKAVIRAHVTTDTGTFTGLGEADVNRDRRLKEAILELAETRAIARALRFAGYGVELTGAEEVSHLRDRKEEADA